MTVTDPIADMLTRIRNAIIANHETVDVPGSRMKMSIARVLKEEGFLENYKFLKDNKQGIIKIFIKYDEDENAIIRGIERISKPGRRVYTRGTEVPRIKRGLGIAILSTSKGIMTDRQARADGVGGEILCKVW